MKAVTLYWSTLVLLLTSVAITDKFCDGLIMFLEVRKCIVTYFMPM